MGQRRALRSRLFDSHTITASTEMTAVPKNGFPVYASQVVDTLHYTLTEPISSYMTLNPSCGRSRPVISDVFKS